MRRNARVAFVLSGSRALVGIVGARDHAATWPWPSDAQPLRLINPATTRHLDTVWSGWAALAGHDRDRSGHRSAAS